MGMAARTCVWVGYDAREAFGRLPDEISDKFKEEGEVEVNGVVIRDFFVGRERTGLGVELLCHDWNYDLKELDLAPLARKASKLKPRVSQIFKVWGVDDEPKVLLASDFS
jgi:hypothetical protein